MPKSRPQPPRPDRRRSIRGSFSWIDHRFLREGFDRGLTRLEKLLYFVLVAVSNQDGVSFYSDARKHKIWKLLRRIPAIGPIRAAILIAVMQTPHRFRTKRQLWNYSGLGLETYDSAEYRAVQGQLERSRKQATVRGLNKDYNHDLKDIFKGAAMRASTASGPLRDFYENLLAKGRKPTMARLTLARKIAAITLIVWKKEVRFDAHYLKQQAA